MKPKGGAKCSRRFHSLWLKCLESRKRVRLGRKRFWSHDELAALVFRESGQVCVQQDTEVRKKRLGRASVGKALPLSPLPVPGSADLPLPCLGPLGS